MSLKLQLKPSIYGTGLIALDLVVSALPNHPIQSWAGGTCGNVLTILSYLGWKAYPIARLNGDAASIRVKDDITRWGVKLDFAEQLPTASTPIIVQKNSQDKSGNPIHKFSWHCPNCGAWLPSYKAVTSTSAKAISDKLKVPSVFFFDRVSPAALIIAKKCKEMGALIFFEPSGKCEPQKMEQALELADIIKYSNERIGSLESQLANDYKVQLEIKTLGSQGLSFRTHLFGKKKFKWFDLEPPIVGLVKDACGCGDWTTAGIIAKICDQRGVASLHERTFEQIIEAMNYGQALAAWNCGFEGARGGMYCVNRAKFNRDISKILTSRAHTPSRQIKSVNFDKTSSNICPLCCP